MDLWNHRPCSMLPCHETTPSMNYPSRGYQSPTPVITTVSRNHLLLSNQESCPDLQVTLTWHPCSITAACCPAMVTDHSSIKYQVYHEPCQCFQVAVVLPWKSPAWPLPTKDHWGTLPYHCFNVTLSQEPHVMTTQKNDLQVIIPKLPRCKKMLKHPEITLPCHCLQVLVILPKEILPLPPSPCHPKEILPCLPRRHTQWLYEGHYHCPKSPWNETIQASKGPYEPCSCFQATLYPSLP
jgi:hypothetical protein